MKKLTGVVERRSGYAAKLGFPTINIPLNDSEPSGIYVAVVVVGNKRYSAAAYADQMRGVLEAHIIDFDGVLDGQTVTIELHEKIRDTATFPDEDALRLAIANDIAQVRTRLTVR